MSAGHPERSPALQHGAAFESLFRAHYAELCAFAHRYVRSKAIAEEVVQDVFLRIWQRREERNLRSIKRAYLFRAARNHALKHLGRAQLERRWKKRHLTLEPTAAPPLADPWAASDRAAEVWHAVESLPGRCKEIFLLIRFDGLRYAEVARMLRISPKTVEAQMVRAVKLLRERLAEQRPDIE